MPGSVLTAVPEIAENSQATPGLWNNIYSIISQNVSQINSDVSVNVSTSRLSTNTIGAQSGNTVRLVNGQDWIARSYDSGGAVFNVRAFGAVGDGSVDDTAAIQRAMDTAGAAGGGDVYFPAAQTPGAAYRITSTLTIRYDNIKLRGAGWQIQATPTVPPSYIQASALNGPIVSSTTTATVNGFAAFDLGFSGGGASNALSQGIRIFNANDPWLERLFFDNFGGSAVTAGGTVVGLHMVGCFAQNSLLSAQPADAGVFDLRATDVRASDNFAVSSATTIGNGRSFGWVVRSSNGFYHSCMGDISHHGWLVTANAVNNVFQGCRAFLNMGNGFVVSGGGGNSFNACKAISNSSNANVRWSGFSTRAGGNVYTDCFVDGVSGDPTQQSGGFFDANNTGTNQANANRYTNCHLGSTVSAELFLPIGAGGAVVEQDGHLAVDSGPDRGDANFTAIHGTHPQTIWYRTALTANRTVSFSSIAVVPGARFRVARTALGNFTLALEDPAYRGVFFTMPANTSAWADVEFLAGAIGWYLTGYGVL